MTNPKATETGTENEELPPTQAVTPTLTQAELLRQAHEVLATIETHRTETAERLGRARLDQDERQKELGILEVALEKWTKAKEKALQWKNHGTVAQYLVSKAVLMSNADRLEKKYRALQEAYKLKWENQPDIPLN